MDTTLYKERLIKLLRTYDIDVDLLINKLQISTAIISGSIVLQSILDECYKTDIDIYCTTASFMDLIEPPGFINNRAYYEARTMDIRQYNIPYCLYLISYECRDGIKNIQLIIVDIFPPKIINYFDLTCCMNYFDGNKLYISYPETLQKISYHCLNPGCITHNDKTIERINKYHDRGFTFRPYTCKNCDKSNKS
jgi:hypothetical protein